MMATSREILLKAIQQEEDNDLLKIIRGQASKFETVNMVEAFVAFNNREQNALCERWKVIVDQYVSDLLNESPEEITKDQENTVLGTTAVLSAVLREAAFSLAELLLPIVRVLHDCLPRLPSSLDKLKNRICQVCEQWWIGDLVSKQTVSEHAVLYLLQRTVSAKNFVKLDIKRVYSMRECLKSCVALDEPIRALLQQCASSSFYVQNSDGRKFISYAFNLRADLVDALHYDVKIKLVDCTASDSSHYGDIYFQAWWLSENNNIQSKLEDSIQDIIQHAVSASSQKLFTSFYKFLNRIHTHRNQKRFGEMLYRLYEPILWRSLKVANGTVRFNATSVFFSMFPLEDPSAKTVEADEDIQRQLNVIEDLLFDPYPLVRARAIVGTCNICNQYWDLIPPPFINRLMANLVEKLAFDAASVQVRITVFKGLCIMIDNPMTHTFLKALLPKVGHCLHDVSESVRIVFLEMLLKMRGLRKIKFWDVTPVEGLLARLAVDTNSVGRRIVSLIFKSYHPITKGNEVLLERSVSLITSNRAASQHFYLHVHNFLSLDNIVNFMLLVCQCLYKYTTMEIRKAIARGEMDHMYEDPYVKMAEEEEEYVDGGGDLNFDIDFQFPLDVISGLLDAVSIVWTTVRPKLAMEQGKVLHKRLLARFVIAIPKFYKFFKESEVAQSVIFLSSFMPSSHVQMSVSYCASKLRAVTPESPPESYENLLESMCNWGRSDDVLELVSDYINAGFSTEFNTPARAKLRTGAKSVRFREPREPCPQLGVDFLMFMLKQPSCQNQLLNGERKTLIDLTKRLRKVQNMLNEQLMANVDLDVGVDTFSTSVFQLMCKLTVLLHNEDGNPPFDGIQFLSVTLSWVENDVLTQLLAADDQNSSVKSSNSTRSSLRLRNAEKRPSQGLNSELAFKVIMYSLDICHNTFLVGVVNIRLAARIADYVGVLLTRNVATCTSEKDCCEVIREIMCNIQQLHEYSLVSGNNGKVICETTVPTLIGAFFSSLRVCLERFPDAKTDFAAVLRPSMLDTLKNYSDYTPVNSKTLRDVMSTLMTTVIGDLANHFNNDQEAVDPESEELPADIDSLPALSYVIISIIVSRVGICRLFLKEVIVCLKSGAIRDPNELLAAHWILLMLQKNKASVVELKEALLVLEDLTLKMQRLDDTTDEAFKTKIQKAAECLTLLKKLIGVAPPRQESLSIYNE